MEYSEFRLTLDIHEAGSQTRLTVKEQDTDRRLRVLLTEQGQPWTVTEDCTAVFTARKPDGQVVFNHCTVEDGAVVYVLTPQTTAVPGLVLCEVRLYGPDDRLLTSPRFSLLVDPTVYRQGDPVESAQEVTALTRLISQTGELVRQVEDDLASGAFRGEKGDKGDKGDPGYELTQQDRTDLVAAVLEALPNGDEVSY